ncbi:MAG: hypothetical protein EBE86_007330 [Hormoscilla sp. GUM202]|nr:hypothetical protein [Hormoscilla sp. GUM202]
MTNEPSKDSTTKIEVQMNFQAQVNAATGKAENVIVNPKQTLADYAAEIQELLQILHRSYPSDIPADTQAEIDVAVKGIERNMELKERVIGALKAGGREALKELADNVYVNTLLAAYEGWRNPE